VTEAILSARGLSKEYGKALALVRAVDGVSLTVIRGESVAIVGPSGCGKSTLLYLLGGLERPTAGTLALDGREIHEMPEARLAQLRRHGIGFVFQAFHLVDELTALENVELPALLAGASPRSARERARELLQQVDLENRADHLPSALSGGQRQRVAIARALALSPDLVVCDEPVSALDVSVQSQVLELLAELQERTGVAYLFISHDLAVVRQIAHEVAVMRAGRVVETGPPEALFTAPRHAYTRELLAAIPGGRVPSPTAESTTS